MTEEEKNKLILDSFGHMMESPELARSMAKGAEAIRRAEKEYRQAVSDRLLYNQCAYGL